MLPHLDSFPLIFDKRPAYYLIHVTSKCNAECSHCFYWENIRDGRNEKDTGLEEFEKISRHMGEVLVVNLCGAEAYLRSDLCEIAHFFAANNHCRLITIPSNGYLTERIVSYAARLCRENPETFFRFAFSIDGPKEAHDTIRGVPGLFDRVCETVRQIASLRKQFSNFVLITSTVFSSETQDHILDFLDWIKEHLPVEQTNVTFIRGDPLKLETLRVNPEIYQRLIEKIKRDAALQVEDRKISAILPYSMFLNTLDTIVKANQNPNQRVFKCFGGQKFLVIGRKGNVYPCELLDERFMMGNLKEFDYDIQRLIRSPQAQAVVQWVSEKHCACTWECAIQASKIFDPLQWPALALRTLKVTCS